MQTDLLGLLDMSKLKSSISQIFTGFADRKQTAQLAGIHKYTNALRYVIHLIVAFHQIVKASADCDIECYDCALIGTQLT